MLYFPWLHVLVIGSAMHNFRHFQGQWNFCLNRSFMTSGCCFSISFVVPLAVQPSCPSHRFPQLSILKEASAYNYLENSCPAIPVSTTDEGQNFLVHDTFLFYTVQKAPDMQ